MQVQRRQERHRGKLFVFDRRNPREVTVAAYYVLMHTIVDVKRYLEEYIPAATPVAARHGGAVVAATFEAEGVQGNPPGAVTIVRFPSAEAVRAFVADPDYLPAKKVRLAITCESSAVIVPEFGGGAS
jgi:uncharacterized protein (DUF1330 family)